MGDPLNPNGPPQTHSIPVSPADRETSAQRLHAKLDELWERSKPTLLERVAILDQAGRRPAQHRLDDAARLHAIDAAHKLAGVLGAFGLPQGTELAREAEQSLGNPTGNPGLTRLGAIADELRRLIEGRPATVR